MDHEIRLHILSEPRTYEMTHAHELDAAGAGVTVVNRYVWIYMRGSVRWPELGVPYNLLCPTSRFPGVADFRQTCSVESSRTRGTDM